MKKDDFTTTIVKMLADKQDATQRAREEMAKLETEITDLQAKIDAYTDVTDVKTYSDLKDNLEVRQHKLEVLKRELSAKATDRNDAQDTAILNGFISEVQKLDDENAAEMLEIIRTLETKLYEATTKRDHLKRLFDSWINVYGLPASYYASFPTTDGTGVTGNVQRLTNALRGIGKL